MVFRTGVFLFGLSAGAAAAATQTGISDGGVSSPREPVRGVALTTGGGSSVAGMLLPVVARPQRDEVVVLRAAERVRQDRVAREKSAKEEAARKQAEEAARKKVYPPVTGVITSNFGPRWGSTHYGLDIANKIGTPIRTPLRGTVVDAGPASGFGLWVRIRHDDGTVTVYGHINDYGVRVGQRVEAGQVIAEVGNKGISTGPHLHFEVWEPGGRKADPLRWLKDRGADIGDER
ncbi:M23 family metallopeptidase [Amycolatopsis roodepoortensis]|nr:M23 family metallopeptidase [Amycolatopsis roodepoortensis]